MKQLALVLFMFTSTYAASPVMQSPSPSGRQYEIYELTFFDSTAYSNPFWDVTILADFSSPTGIACEIRGFYYDTFTWKIRFTPTEIGNWTYVVKYMRTQDTTGFSGAFTVTGGSSHGFIHIDPSKPNKFSYTDGTNYIPIGSNGHTPAVTAAYLGIPAGPQQVPAMWDTLEAHGINTYRLDMFNQEAFADSFSWNSDEGMANLVYHTGSLNMYDLRTGKLMDRWFEQALAHHINIYLCMFTLFDISQYPFSTSPWSSSRGGPFSDINAPYASAIGVGAGLEREYYTYIVNRWGAYRNLFAWEYNNEYGYYSMPAWVGMIDSVISENDPYAHPHSVSFWNYSYSSNSQVNSLAGIDMTDDHLYAFNNWNEFNIDSAANAQSVTRYFKYGKPVMFGELGSADGVYGPSWMTFIRAGYWSAFAGGGYPLLWLCGDISDSGYAFNRAELELLSAAGTLSSALGDPSTLRPANSIAVTSMPSIARCYTLQGDSDIIVYFRSLTSDASPINGLSCSLFLSGATGKAWKAVWLDPSSGDSAAVSAGTSAGDTLILNAPSFKADLLLHLRVTGGVTALNAAESGSVAQFRLDQNFPNPFNPATAIGYHLSTVSHVTLKVYDVLGRVVANLVNHVQRAGRYEVRFDGSNLPSGVYFYRLEAGNYTATKKLMLVK